MDTHNFRGLGIALITPFNADKSINYKAFGGIIENVINNGANFLVPIGSTGETSTLSREEEQEIINYVVKKNANRLPILVGIGGNNTAEVVGCLKTMDFSGVQGILSICPYYNKPTQKGIYEHFKTISKASPVPIILYNIPGRCVINMTAETILNLSKDFKNIIGLKESSNNLPQLMHVLKKRNHNFVVLSGDDIMTVPFINLGADGVISVIGNALPKQTSQMVNAAIEGNNKKALEIHYKMLDLMETLFLDGNPAGIKHLMSSQGFCQNYLRLPLCPVSEETSILINKSFKDIL